MRLCGWSRLRRCAVHALLLLLPAAWAQDNEPGAPIPATATLPESNEALLKTAQVDEALRAGDFRLAAELVAQIMDLPSELVASPASRTYYPVWRQAARLLWRFPAPGVEVYRQLYDGEVRARLAQARQKADLQELRTLFRRFPLCTAWFEIGHELASRLIDHGHFGEAIQVLREMLSVSSEERPEQTALLVVALELAGGHRSAAAIVRQLAVSPSVQNQPAWNDRLRRLQDWLASRAEVVAAATGVLAPRLAPAAAWTQPLVPAAGAEQADDDDEVASAVEMLRRLPLLEPAMADGRLLLRVHGQLLALDALTLTRLWQADEFTGVDPGSRQAALRIETDDGAPLSRNVDLLLNNHLRHAISTADGAVYTIESLTLGDGESVGFGRRAFMPDALNVAKNELIARDAATGRLLWRSGDDPSGPLADVAFQDVPLLLPAGLVAPFRRDGEVRLAVLEPVTGRLLHEIPVVGPPTYFNNRGGRCLLAADETTLYVCTGNGVIAAMDRTDLSWLWATAYPSTLSQHLGQQWWMPFEQPRESGIDRPIVAGDLLILAPVDSPDIHAVERFSGREVWRIPRRTYGFLIGATADGVILGGGALLCVDPDDPAGKPPRWRTVPLDIVGRPAMRDSRVYVPTRDGVVVVDARNGKLRDATPAESNAAQARQGAANLLVTDEALYRISPSRVVQHPDPAAVLRRLQALQASAPGDERTILLAGWLDVIDGKFNDALDRLAEFQPTDAGVALARERLLTHVLIELARTAPAGGDRLAWLQKATEVARSPELSSRLGVIFGAALEEEQRWELAAAHYADIMLSNGAGVVADAEFGLRSADWVHAASRLRAVRQKLGAAALQALADHCIERAATLSNGSLLLARVRLALEGDVSRNRIEQCIALRQSQKRELAPEHLLSLLPESESGLTAEQTRAVHLVRWETHVALHMASAAGEDARRWRDEFAANPPADALAAARESDWLQRIQSGVAKLDGPRSVVFGPDIAQRGRQWRVKPAELLIDPRQPLLMGDGDWFLNVHNGDRRVQLRKTLDNQLPQRERPFGINLSRADPLPRAINMNVLWRGEESLPDAWPMATHGAYAAIPMPGGIACVGLGPGLTGGYPLWEYAIPTWTEPPRDFAAQTAVGPRGLYLATRQDRVALLGWLDGRVWWQRDFPGATIRAMHCVSDLLVVESDDGQVWLMSATFGDSLRRLPGEFSALRGVDVVGDVLVCFAEGMAAAIEPRTLEVRWMVSLAAVDRRCIVADRPWIVIHQRDHSDWDVMDATSGRFVLTGITAVNGRVVAAASYGENLLIASHAAEDPEIRSLPTTRVASLALADGSVQWSAAVKSSTPPNETQLKGHPELLPLLIDRLDPLDRAFRVDTPVVALISKSDGSQAPAIQIQPEYDPAETHCAPYLLVTPSRIIVQISGNLIAFGYAPVAGEP